LEEPKFHLFAEVWVDTGKNVSVKGAGPMPDVPKEEEQGEGGMTESKPAPRRTSESSIGMVFFAIKFKGFS
jgi:hypothetical protein